MKISVSQIKTATASLAKRAGMYILQVKDEFENDSLALGNLFEKYLIEKVEDWEIIKDVSDKEKVVTQYDALKHNATGLEIPEWYYQYKIEWELFWCDFLWYADIFRNDCIYDIKTIGKTGDTENTYPNMRSWLTYMEEYELQMRAYMKVTGIKKSQILAIGKFLYKDGRHDHKVIDIDRSDELDERMTKKFWVVVEKMKDLFAKY